MSTWFRNFSNSFFAIPLAFIGIPIYLNVADFYAQSFSLNLALIGFLLIFIRGFDAIQDPLVGYFSDKMAANNFSHQKIIRSFSILLCLGFYLVFNPPKNLSSGFAAAWFTVFLSLTYLSFNFVLINFESLIAMSATTDQQRVSINSIKEFLGVIGMILAFILPGIFTQIFSLADEQKYFCLSLSFLGLIVLANLLFKPKFETQKNSREKIHFSTIFHDKKFVSFLVIFLINAVAVSLPAANMNFYVRDVLGSEKNIPWFLSLYFISAALFIPLWRFLFNLKGITKIWITSIFGSVLTFFGAFFLGKESSDYFFLICVLSGIFLGADLIAPPIILAQITQNKTSAISSYFSLWNFTTKLGLMISASGSLIILGFFEYQSGNPSNSSSYLLSIFYAALPCLLKSIVIALLLRFKNYEN